MSLRVNTLTNWTMELQLNNPLHHNALTLQDWLEGEKIIAHAAQDPNVRTLIVTGSNRSFCAGADVAFLRQLQTMGTAQRRQSLEAGSRLVKALIRFPGATIAAVDGPAIGIGASLALACDSVFATERSRFGLVFTSLGLPGGDMAASWLVARRAGFRVASRLFADASTINAVEAAQLRLVDGVVDSIDCARIAQDADLRVARIAPDAAATTKRQILEMEGAFADLDGHMHAQLEALVAAVGGDDFNVALNAQARKVPAPFARRTVPPTKSPMTKSNADSRTT